MFSKVKAGGIAGLIVTLVVMGLGQLGVEADPALVALITTIVSAILAYFKVEKVGAYKKPT